MDVDGRLGLRFEEAIVDIIIQMVRLVAFSASNGQFIRYLLSRIHLAAATKGAPPIWCPWKRIARIYSALVTSNYLQRARLAPCSSRTREP